MILHFLAWEREPRNTVGTYCGSKDRWFIRHWIECFIIRLTQMYVSQWGSLAATSSFWKAVFFTASHARIRIRYYKSRVLHLNVQWNQRFVWLNHYHHSTKKYREKNHSLPLAFLLMLHTHNNTDGNKLVIFSGIASYYGDNYII